MAENNKIRTQKINKMKIMSIISNVISDNLNKKRIPLFFN